MGALLAVSRAIDGLSRWTGLIAIWLVLLASLVSAFNAFFRYSINGILYLERSYPLFGNALLAVFNLYRDNSNTLRDIQLVMFAGMVMLGAGWTLKLNEHVRVDLVYGSVSYRTRDWIDLIGGIFFLLPVCILLLWLSWPWFLESWRSNEMSPNAGGLPRWPLKLMVPIGFALVLLQGISEIIKTVASLFFGHRREQAYEKPLQ